MAFDDGSLFGDYDVASAPDDPFAVPDGIYPGEIVNFRKQVNVRDDGTSWAVLVVETKADNGLTLQHQLGLPGQGDSEPQILQKRSRMRGFLTGIEIPESRMNSVRADEIIGTRVVVTVTTSISKKNQKPYKNFAYQLPKGSPVGTLPAGSAAGTEVFAQAAGRDTVKDDFDL